MFIRAKKKGYYSGLNRLVNQRDTFTRFFVANSICLSFNGLVANQKRAFHHKPLIDIYIFDLNSYEKGNRCRCVPGAKWHAVLGR
jgi:hypothetical protein